MIATANSTNLPLSAAREPRQAVNAQINREALLIVQTQQGSQTAFNELVLTHQDAVYRQAYWILNDAAAADDAAQEAFFRAYTRIDTYNGSSFRAWILRITTNYCLDQIRRGKSHPSQPLEAFDRETEEENENSSWLVDPNQSPEQAVEAAEQQAWLTRCLKKLSPEDRAAVILVDVQELSYQDAAAVMKLSLPAFKSRLVRARARLVQFIQVRM
jgi:RNA polymerase sigma-70 factor (ECF subfamily)